MSALVTFITCFTNAGRSPRISTSGCYDKVLPIGSLSRSGRKGATRSYAAFNVYNAPNPPMGAHVSAECPEHNLNKITPRSTNVSTAGAMVAQAPTDARWINATLWTLDVPARAVKAGSGALSTSRADGSRNFFAGVAIALNANLRSKERMKRPFYNSIWGRDGS